MERYRPLIAALYLNFPPARDGCAGCKPLSVPRQDATAVECVSPAGPAGDIQRSKGKCVQPWLHR